MQSLPETILFYDGLCGLCDHLVQFLVEHDIHGRIYFMPIQSERAKRLLMEKGVSEREIAVLSTVYLLSNAVVYQRSRAVFHVVSFLPWPWSLSKGLLWIPSFLADPFYRLVARIRYRIFGRLDQCRIPTPEEKKRFLE